MRPLSRIARGLALVALALAVVGAPAAEAQELRLSGLGGEVLRDADLAQGTLIVVVWASWSPRGRNVAERVNAISQRWGSRSRVVTVNFQEDRQAVEAFLSAQPLRVPVFLDPDGAFAKRYALTNLPGLLVMRDGEAAYRGKLPDDPDRLLGEIFG